MKFISTTKPQSCSNNFLKAAMYVGILTAFAACATAKGKMPDKERQAIFVYDFKLTYFRKLLQTGFNNSTEINQILRADRSTGYGEPLLSMEDYAIIDSLAMLDNSRMVADSASRIGTVSEGAQGKHVFTYALSGFESNSLDSLAKERYKLSLFGIQKDGAISRKHEQ